MGLIKEMLEGKITNFRKSLRDIDKWCLFKVQLVRVTEKWAFTSGSLVKNPFAMQETLFWSLGWEDPLEKEMANHSSILAWESP